MAFYFTCCSVSSGGPQKARGNIIGTINDVEFGIAFLNATIFTDISGGRVIHATITNIPRSLGQSQDFFSISRSQISILRIVLSWSSLIRSRPWNEETDLSAESHLLDHSTGDRRGHQRLQPYRRHLQTRDPSGVCDRWVQLGVFKSSKASFKSFCSWIFWRFVSIFSQDETEAEFQMPSK